MFDFNPFITNDGSVGLYSKADNDIYHSVYGALSESYEKFIFPANIPYYLLNKEKINVLDICYGIGYNTKAFMQYILNLYYFSHNTDLIYNDKIFDNEQNVLSSHIELIYSDKIDKNKCLTNITCKKISIDAIDNDNNLIMLSAFIKNKYDYKNILNINHQEAIKAKNKLLPQKINEKFLISNEVLYLIYEALKKTNNIDNKFLREIFNEYKDYFSSEMMNIDSENELKNNDIFSSIKKFLDINLICSDAIKYLINTEKTYDIVFLDAFTPTKCPKLWTIDFFNLLYNKISNNGIILTYSNSALVRNAFMQSGYQVGKIYSKLSNKFCGTIATKNGNFIENNLSQFDLGLLNSKAGIPFRDIEFKLSEEQILEHRKIEVEQSDLISSSKYIKMYKNS